MKLIPKRLIIENIATSQNGVFASAVPSNAVPRKKKNKPAMIVYCALKWSARRPVNGSAKATINPAGIISIPASVAESFCTNCPKTGTA